MPAEVHATTHTSKNGSLKVLETARKSISSGLCCNSEKGSRKGFQKGFLDQGFPEGAWNSLLEGSPPIRADFWGGDATKHFSVRKKGFSLKRGEAIQ